MLISYCATAIYCFSKKKKKKNSTMIVLSTTHMIILPTDFAILTIEIGFKSISNACCGS